MNLNVHRIAYSVLSVVIVGFFVYTKMLENAVELAQDQKYVLPANLSQRYIYKDRILKTYKRDDKGNTVVTKKYIPDEGGVDVRVSTPTKKNDGSTKSDVEFIIKDKGLTIRPGVGAVYETPDVLATVDVKLLYWSRASAGAGLTSRSLNLWGSYHMDWLPYWHPQNLELTVGRSMLRFDGKDNRWHVGFRVNF